MAKLARKLLTLFGRDGSSSSFGQFGSQTAGAPLNTKDILSIQALQAWISGWQNAVYGANKAPFLEDMNALHYVMAYQMCYGFQEGVPEYDSTTTYYIGSIVKKTGTSEFYMSLTDTNIGNALPSKSDNSNWQYVNKKGILQYDSAYSYSTNEIVQKPGTAELYKSLQNSNVGNPLPNQTSSAIWQYLVDLANLAPPPVGVSKIQFGFAHVTLTATTTTSSSVTKIPTVDLGFDSDTTVYAFVFLHESGISLNMAASATFPGVLFIVDRVATLSGSGVDSSGAFLAGGAPSNAYTLTLTFNYSGSVGSGPVTSKATVLFIGIK